MKPKATAKVRAEMLRTCASELHTAVTGVRPITVAMLKAVTDRWMRLAKLYEEQAS